MITAKKWLPCVASLILSSGCVADGDNTRGTKPKASTLEQAMSEAGTAMAAGEGDRAQMILKTAATSYPADKAPWLQMAQYKFERHSYGEAITNALEALQRDPSETRANSIVAVSGLRLSNKALSDLSRQKNLNPILRSEAQDLAKLLRSSLGEETPPPVPPKSKPGSSDKRPLTPANQAGPTVKPVKPANSSDPFGGLK